LIQHFLDVGHRGPVLLLGGLVVLGDVPCRVGRLAEVLGEILQGFAHRVEDRVVLGLDAVGTVETAEDGRVAVQLVVQIGRVQRGGVERGRDVGHLAETVFLDVLLQLLQPRRRLADLFNVDLRVVRQGWWVPHDETPLLVARGAPAGTPRGQTDDYQTLALFISVVM
jgi:hypothetical protein